MLLKRAKENVALKSTHSAILPQKIQANLTIADFMFKKPYLYQYLMDSITNEGSKFKLGCVKMKHSYMLWIKVLSFKLRLINFVYFNFKDTR